MSNDSTPAPPTPDEIARLAYGRYEARGRKDGSDLEDWFAAEQEARLRQSGLPHEPTTSVAPIAGPIDNTIAALTGELQVAV